VGHSLGGALALLDGVFLSLRLGSGVSINVTTYGMPRVGNQAFADFVDGQLPGLVTHVNNQEDPVPTVPGRFLGFHHPSGEIHIQDSGAWDACPGAFPDLSPFPPFPSCHTPRGLFLSFLIFRKGADVGTVCFACSGQDNPSQLCTVGDVPIILEGNLINHDGPYGGITMGC
jgi:hypothetical protein